MIVSDSIAKGLISCAKVTSANIREKATDSGGLFNCIKRIFQNSLQLVTSRTVHTTASTLNNAEKMITADMSSLEQKIFFEARYK